MLNIKPLQSVLAKKKEPNSKIELLNTTKIDKRVNNGGARDGTGPKVRTETIVFKDIQKLIEAHGLEEIDVKIGKKIVKKARILALLNVLYEKGMSRGDVKAIQEYLNRNLGKAKESLNLTGNLTIEDLMEANRKKKQENSILEHKTTGES